MGHHLILGELTDYLSGETLDDTDDERLRQQIARQLVEIGGFDRGQIQPRVMLRVQAGVKQAGVPVDFVIFEEASAAMLIKYGPGSIVTRHRPTLAMARLFGPKVVPLTVVTNGRDADVLDALTGKVIGSGMEAVPTHQQLLAYLATHPSKTVTDRQAEMAARIVYAFEVDGSCLCDDTICRIPTDG
jgi:hypothetical protein